MSDQREAARASGHRRGNSELTPRQDAAGRALHERLLAGDPTASTDLVRAYQHGLTVWLSRYTHADPRDCRTAARNAIRALSRHPESYQPDRQRLAVYLRVSAVSDLKGVSHRDRQSASAAPVL
jgi:hypothetical protein